MNAKALFTGSDARVQNHPASRRGGTGSRERLLGLENILAKAEALLTGEMVTGVLHRRAGRWCSARRGHGRRLRVVAEPGA